MAKRSRKSRFKKLRGFVVKAFKSRVKAAGDLKASFENAVYDAVSDYFKGSPLKSEQKSRARGLTQRERDLRADFQVRKAAGGPIAPSKPYSKLTQNLGKDLLQYGQDLPPDIRAAAIDAVNGGGAWANERELQNKLRSATGITRGGGTWLNKKLNKARGYFRNAANAAVLFDVSSRGGMQGALAQTELMSMAGDGVEALTNNKLVQKVSVGVAKYLGRSPLEARSFLYALSRVARLGGAVGAGLQLMTGAIEEYFSSQKRASAARIRQFDDARSMGIDAGVARNLRNQTQTTAGTGIGGWFRETFGFTGEIEEERADRLNKKFQILNQAQKQAGRFGVDAAGLLQARANKLGIGIEDLTQEEVQETLQPELMKAARERVSSAQVQSELEQRGVFANNRKLLAQHMGWAAWAPPGLMLQAAAGVVDLFTDANLTPEKLKAEQDKVTDEFALRHLKATSEENQRQAEVASRAKRDQERTTKMQMREFKMNADSWGRRKQVSWAD